MQPVDFKSFEEFLDFLPENQRELTMQLDALVFDCIPGAQRKLSYNVPFYSLHKRICFIWPAAVPWGNVKQEGVQFGFCTGYKLNDPEGFLERGNRKQVFSKTFMSYADFVNELEILKHFLFEAAEVDRS